MFRTGWATKIAGLTLGVGLLAGSALPVMADDLGRSYRDQQKCEEKIRKAEEKLHKELRKHGPHSSQAERRRHDLMDARRQCRFDAYGDRDRYRDRDHDRDHDRW